MLSKFNKNSLWRHQLGRQELFFSKYLAHSIYFPIVACFLVHCVVTVTADQLGTLIATCCYCLVSGKTHVQTPQAQVFHSPLNFYMACPDGLPQQLAPMTPSDHKFYLWKYRQISLELLCTLKFPLPSICRKPLVFYSFCFICSSYKYI